MQCALVLLHTHIGCSLFSYVERAPTHTLFTSCLKPWSAAGLNECALVLLHTGAVVQFWAPGPMVSERAPAFVLSDTLHWAMKSVKQAVEHWCSKELYVKCAVWIVKCAVCGQYCDLWHSRYCGLCQLLPACIVYCAQPANLLFSSTPDWDRAHISQLHSQHCPQKRELRSQS